MPHSHHAAISTTLVHVQEGAEDRNKASSPIESARVYPVSFGLSSVHSTPVKHTADTVNTPVKIPNPVSFDASTPDAESAGVLAASGDPDPAHTPLPYLTPAPPLAPEVSEDHDGQLSSLSQRALLPLPDEERPIRPVLYAGRKLGMAGSNEAYQTEAYQTAAEGLNDDGEDDANERANSEIDSPLPAADYVPRSTATPYMKRKLQSLQVRPAPLPDHDKSSLECSLKKTWDT